MEELTLNIDGQQITVDKDKTVFEAAQKVGIYIPNLCTHSNLRPTGECGLCLVKIEGETEPAVSCTTKVKEGMIISSPGCRSHRIADISRLAVQE